MKRWLVGVFGILLVAGSVSPALATVHVVKVKSGEFSPAEITVQKNDVIRWEWESGSHMLASGEGPDDPEAGSSWDGLLVDSQHRAAERTFASAGTFRYFSRTRPDVQGSITVLDGTPVDRATWGFLKQMFEGPTKPR